MLKTFLATACALALLTVLMGGLVTIHADTPHTCPYHKGTVTCSHSNDPGDLHAPGEQSTNAKKAGKAHDAMDLVGCGCFWVCLFNGAAASNHPLKSIHDHGLFYRG